MNWFSIRMERQSIYTFCVKIIFLLTWLRRFEYNLFYILSKYDHNSKKFRMHRTFAWYQIEISIHRFNFHFLTTLEFHISRIRYLSRYIESFFTNISSFGSRCFDLIKDIDKYSFAFLRKKTKLNFFDFWSRRFQYILFY